MNYSETIDYLFNSVPMFQNIGAKAYKPGLHTTHLLDEHLGHPHLNYKTVHIAGTNGKGSCSHTLASILQSAGYKVGLFTSPHLIDFRERIRVNGQMIAKDYVVDFIEQHHSFFEKLHPSFFELTTLMALKYFEEQKVDLAIIEVGLGGRLDCTNIINPILSIITNISYDHTQFLGNTLQEIAGEKAGIIKANIPVVIGETLPETRPIFNAKANEVSASIYFAEDYPEIIEACSNNEGNIIYNTHHFGQFIGELGGEYQIKNTNTILHAIQQLKDFPIQLEAVHKGFAEVHANTGLQGRWQKLSQHPDIICDAGHNEGGWTYLQHQLEEIAKDHTLHIIFGAVNDKDINAVLNKLPQKAHYYWTEAKIKRALPHRELQKLGRQHNLVGNSYSTVANALSAAKVNSTNNDVIFVGGSCFIVGELLSIM